MSTDVVADFRPEVFGDGLPVDDSTEGRVLMNREGVVAVTSDHELRVPLAAIVDVTEKTPAVDAEFVDTVLAIEYVTRGERHTLFVGSEPEEIHRFRHVLFKALLTGLAVQAVHPARVGGRVVDVPPMPAEVSISEDRLSLRGPDEVASIRLANVTDLSRTKRAFDGDTPKPAIRIHHFQEGNSRVTVLGTDEDRLLHVLERFLELKYADLRKTVVDLDLTDREVEALVTLYSGGGVASLAQTLGLDASRVDWLLAGLETKELVEDADDPELTDMGRVVVNEYLESVNT